MIKGGIDVQEFVRIVVAALEDHKITAEEFDSIQAHFGKLSASEQATLTRELANQHVFQSNQQSLSALQSVLAHGTFAEFNAGIALPTGYWGGGGGHLK